TRLFLTIIPLFMLYFTIFRFYFIAVFGFFFKIIRFLEFRLFTMFILLYSNRVGFAFVSSCITALSKWTNFAFFNVKIICIFLVFADVFLSLTSFPYSHMTSLTDIHSSIFIKFKFIFFRASTLCYRV